MIAYYFDEKGVADIAREAGSKSQETKSQETKSQETKPQETKPAEGWEDGGDGRIYFLNSNPAIEVFGGNEVFEDTLFRVSLEDQTLQRLTSSNVAAYLVCGESIYYIKYGEMVRMKIQEPSAENILQKTEN